MPLPHRLGGLLGAPVGWGDAAAVVPLAAHAGPGPAYGTLWRTTPTRSIEALPRRQAGRASVSLGPPVPARSHSVSLTSPSTASGP
ncbi:hypothetical protein [Streptomyces goshikiensis]|uniref:hypothetical protein n=1 Tax=Streptomyces goshikiensis TaxID=1942 RepID=UPI003656BF85